VRPVVEAASSTPCDPVTRVPPIPLCWRARRISSRRACETAGSTFFGGSGGGGGGGGGAGLPPPNPMAL